MIILHNNAKFEFSIFSDQRHSVERSLQTMFTPPLSITGLSSCPMSRVCLQISYQSLCAWFTDYHKIEKVVGVVNINRCVCNYW